MTTPQSFMRHLTATHEGTAIDEHMFTLLRGLGRAVCTGPGCGCIRQAGTRQCHRCGQSRALRPLAVGDVIPGGRGVPLRAAADAVQPPANAAAPDGRQGDIQPPVDFAQRVRRLPSHSLVHIPVAAREKICRATQDVWAGMAAGLPGWTAIEEGRTKLLLAGIPSGAHVPQEVLRRADLFLRRSYEELLSRVELQMAGGGRQGRRRKQTTSHRQEQARRQTAEGAYRKAVQTLTTSVAQLTPEQNMEWAVRLHPRAADPATACSAQDGPLQPPPQEPDISAEADEDPLRGVRFGTLKAPGPTGLRPEHIAELLAVRRRRTARRLRRTLGLLLDAIASGSVVEEGRWLTYSRLIYLQKKRGELILDTPRPIKVGEVLRSAAAKRTLRKHEQTLLPTLIRMRQYGVSLPGGAEALAHWRATVEEAAKAGIIRPVVTADLDMKNFFNSVEWDAIRRSVQEHLEVVAPSVAWEQKVPGTTILPDGAAFNFDRGAEQGETFGAVKAVLPLGDACCDVRHAMRDHHGFCDEWFVDDGQLVCTPEMFDPWLRAFDAAIEKIGATRGQGADVKSSAKLVCLPGQEEHVPPWVTDYVRQTCSVLETNSTSVVLGATVGDDADIEESAAGICARVSEQRAMIATVDHAATELVLTRSCADVAKLSYWLRCYGDVLGGGTADRGSIASCARPSPARWAETSATQRGGRLDSGSTKGV